MTHVLIDRALAEATLRELNLAAVTYAALGKVILKDGAEAMRDKLSAALANAEPTGWQPIETAPKDAIVILCLPPFKGYRLDDRRVYEGRWHEPQATWTSVNGFLLLGEAANWMPLPTPPKEQP